MIAQLVCAQQTPWYLPRTGAAVVFIQGNVVSPATRLGWEVDLTAAAPYIEGRLKLGWRVGVVTLSACGGYGQSIARVAAPLGGGFAGVLVGWK